MQLNNDIQSKQGLLAHTEGFPGHAFSQVALDGMGENFLANDNSQPRDSKVVGLGKHPEVLALYPAFEMKNG